MIKILCPVDFKEPSYNAARVAYSIAAQLETGLIYLHATTQPVAEIHDRLQAGFERLGFQSGILKDSEIEFETSNKGLKKAVEELKTNNEIGLLVMGTNGISGITEYYSGTHSENLIGSSVITSLLLPDSFRGQSFDRIVFFTNYEDTTVVDLESILLFADLFKAKVDVVHFSKAESAESRKHFEEFKARAESAFGKSDRLKVSRIISSDPETSILEYVVSNDCDLIAIHKDQFHPADGSKTDVLTRMAQIPLLILKK